MALIDTIISNGNVIKNETVTGSNTATRVGLAITDLAEYAKSISDEGAVSANSVQINTAAGIAVAEGQLAWNALDGTLDIGMAGGNAVLQVGQETYIHVVAGEAISNGDVVYASGTNGASGSIIASKYLADGATRAYLILGVATETIASGASGYITAFGKLRGLDTSAFTEGSILYPSPTVAGALTDVLPISPNVAMPIAFAINSKANGTISVRLTPPNELAELHDVHLTTPVADGELLVYDSVAGHWDNKTLAQAGIGNGATLENIVVVTTANVASTLGGVIDSVKEYFIDGIVDLGVTQITVPTGGITLRGYSYNNSGLHSTEDNYTMFISETELIGSGDILGVDFHITTSGVNSKVYEVYDANGFHAIEMNRVNYTDCTSLGNIYNYRQGLELGTGRFGGSPSLTLHGTWLGGFRISTSITRSMSDTTTEPLFKAGTAFVMNSRFLTDMNVDLGTLQPFLDFSPANFPNPSSLELVDVLLTRDGVINAEDANITPNISEADLASAWSGNHGIHNTFVGGAQDITVEVDTVITTINVATPILGTSVASDLQHFDAPSNGRLRFLGTSPIEYSASWDFILDGVANNTYRIELVRTRDAVETIIYGQTRVISNLQGGRDVAYFTGSHHERILQNDTTHWTVKNLSGTGNCTLEVGSDWTLDHR